LINSTAESRLQTTQGQPWLQQQGQKGKITCAGIPSGKVLPGGSKIKLVVSSGPKPSKGAR
jgi:beta-lactam-binding protein with PASTA domain